MGMAETVSPQADYEAWARVMDYSFMKSPVVQVAGTVSQACPSSSYMRHYTPSGSPIPLSLPLTCHGFLTLTTFPMGADWIGLVVLFGTSALIFSKLVRLVETGPRNGQGGIGFRVKGIGRDRRHFSLQDS